MSGTTKLCPKCGQVKSTVEFNKRAMTKDGLQSKCKICGSKIGKEWNRVNKERLQANCRAWYKANREKALETAKKWKKENPEKCREYVRRRQEANPQEQFFKNKKFRQKNPHYQRERSKVDIDYKLAVNLRHRLRRSIKELPKRGSAVDDLGCSIPELKVHLETLFLPGMSWANYGEWHIDHILPLSSFDLTDLVQLRKACNYKNLQPLWAIDNLKKGSKYVRT